MSDKKISALSSATTPLAGTEELPVVQGGVTDKVSVANLTAGRDVNVKSLSAETNAAGYTGSFLNTKGSPGDGHGLYVQTRYNVAGNIVAKFTTNSGSNDVLTLTGDRNATLHAGNLVIGTAGKGIDFSATSDAAGMTSELLDDYEEGTWTATFTAGTSGTITLQSTHQTGSYTKIGRLVTVTGQFIVDSVASPVGRLTIDGLPFTINNSGNEASTAAAITAFTFDPLTATAIVARGVKGQSRIEVYRWTNPTIDEVADYVKAGTQIYVSMSYIV